MGVESDDGFQLILILIIFQKTRNYAELSRKVLCLTMHDLNPWKLEKWHVRLAMRQEGIYVQNDDAITINSKTLTGPDPRWAHHCHF